jgi:hypothetical protein
MSNAEVVASSVPLSEVVELPHADNEKSMSIAKKRAVNLLKFFMLKSFLRIGLWRFVRTDVTKNC